MKIEKVEELEDGRKLDELIETAVDSLDKLPEPFRALIFIYDPRTDGGTMAMRNYMTHEQAELDIERLPEAMRGAMKGKP